MKSIILEKKPGKTRRSGIEILRFIACCGIVWFHVGANGSQIAYGGLPVFMVISLSFIVHKENQRKPQILNSLQRLIIPWLFWSGIYLFLKIIESIISGKGLSESFHLWMLLTGTSLHLWYLPYAFVIITIIILLKQRLNFMNNKIYIFLAISSGLLILVISSFFRNLEYIIPLNQWIFLFPSIPAGLFFSILNSKNYKSSVYYSGLLVIIMSCIATLLLKWEGLAVTYLAAIIGCSVFFIITKPANPLIEKFGNLTYGVYLCHVIFISFFIKFGVEKKSFELVLFTIIASTISTMILLKTPLKKFI